MNNNHNKLKKNNNNDKIISLVDIKSIVTKSIKGAS